MAKTVKFNMRFGDTSIRTLDDLRENFSIEDVLAHLDNGLLQKFLERRDYAEYAEKVAALAERKPEPEAAAREILSIFGVDTDKTDVDEYAEMLRLRKQNAAEYAAYAQGKSDVKKSIEEYFRKYDEIVCLMIEHKNDLGKIRAWTHELLDTYMPVLKKDWFSLYITLSKNGALYPVCYMLTQEFFRLCWLTENEQSKESGDTRKANELLLKAFNMEIRGLNGEHPWIKVSNKASASYWEDIETAGKEYMILQVPSAAKVRAPGDIHNEMDAGALNSKFITLDGVQYRHNATSDYLFYAEV